MLKGEMTVREAGQRGGYAVAEKYPSEHFQRIAKLASRPSPEVASRIGRLGGAAWSRALTAEEKSRQGALGGQATLARHGREHFARAARAMHAKRAARAQETNLEPGVADGGPA